MQNQASLACLLRDFQTSLSTMPEGRESVEAAPQASGEAACLYDNTEGTWAGVTVATFLVAIYAVAQAYTHWVPLGRTCVCPLAGSHSLLGAPRGQCGA